MADIVDVNVLFTGIRGFRRLFGCAGFTGMTGVVEGVNHSAISSVCIIYDQRGNTCLDTIIAL